MFEETGENTGKLMILRLRCNGGGEQVALECPPESLMQNGIIFLVAPY